MDISFKVDFLGLIPGVLMLLIFSVLLIECIYFFLATPKEDKKCKQQALLDVFDGVFCMGNPLLHVFYSLYFGLLYVVILAS